VDQLDDAERCREIIEEAKIDVALSAAHRATIVEALTKRLRIIEKK